MNKEYNDAYMKGAQDAWDIARKIVSCRTDGGYTRQQLMDIFDRIYAYSVFNENENVRDVFEKVEAYKEKMTKCHAGDVIKCETSTDSFYGIVLNENKDYYTVLRKDTTGCLGCTYINSDIALTKTGEHVDIDEMFDRMEQEV